MNYFLTKKSQHGELTLQRVRFMEVANNPFVPSVEYLRLKRGVRFVIHWCGLHNPPFEKRVRVELLNFFEDVYYSRIWLGRLKQR